MQREKPSATERDLDDDLKKREKVEKSGGRVEQEKGRLAGMRVKTGPFRLQHNRSSSSGGGDGKISFFPERAPKPPSFDASRRFGPDYFRNKYLTRLGIWADDQARQLSSSQATEARYKTCGRSAAFGADPGGDSKERNQRQMTSTSPRIFEPMKVKQQRYIQLQQKTRTPSSSPEVERTAGSARESVSVEPSGNTEMGGGSGDRALLIGRGESKTERVEEAVGGEGRAGVAKDGGDRGSPKADGKGVAAVHGGRGGASAPVCEDELPLSAVRTTKHLSSSVGRSFNKAENQGEKMATTTPEKHPSRPHSSVSSVDRYGAAAGAARGAVPSGVPFDEGVSRNTSEAVVANQTDIPERGLRATAAPSSVPTKPSSIQPSGSSPPKPAATQRPRPVLPPVRSVEPPRRDVRKSYLSSLGMRRVVMVGTGEERTPPPIVRRSPLYGSVEYPAEEQLKDPQSGDKFEDLLRVVRNLLNCRGGDSKENEAHTCRACERERAFRSPKKSNALHCRGREEKQGDGEEKREWESNACCGEGSPGGRVRNAVAGSRASRTCDHKHVEFAPLVSAVYIPVHSEYSDRVRRSYWSSPGEIREMVYRNMIEFDAEDYNWEKVAEEEDMYYCEETKEFIHPIFFDSEEEAREVKADLDREDRVEFITEGRKLPVMQRG